MLFARRARHRFALDPQFQRRVLFTLFGSFSLLGWTIFLLGGSLFTVREVVVEGGEGVLSHEATALVFRMMDEQPSSFFHAKRHVWFFPKDRIRDVARTEWFARDVEVKTRPWSHIVRLIITEEPRVFFVKTEKQYLVVDPRGFVRRELTSDERVAVLQTITNKASPTLASHVQAILELPMVTDMLETRYRIPGDSALFERWMRLQALLREKKIAVRYSVIQADEERLILQNGVFVYIDTLEPLESQVNALALYQEQAKREKLPTPTSIDIRIQGRVYTK